MKRSLIAFLLASLPLCLLSQTKDQPYKYPAPRGSDAFNQLPTYKEKREASQVPDAIVQQLSTSALLETVLNYPLLTDVLLYNDLQKGVNQLRSNFRALPALLLRTDLATVCVARYKRMRADSVNVLQSLVDKGAYSFQLNFIEMLMAQPELSSKLTPAGQRSLLQLLILRFDEKEKLPDIYGTFSRSVNAWPVYRIGVGLSDVKSSIQPDTNLNKGAMLNYNDWKAVIENARAFNR